MSVEYLCLQRSRLNETDKQDLDTVLELAKRLHERLEAAADDIDLAHIHGAQSSAIQAVVSRILKVELDFREEVVITPQDGFVSQARPDFFYSLAEGRGIIAEVERGGTVTNNHDLKDVWKTHISPDAQHLFLVVPISNWSADGKPRERPYLRVCHRLAAFFGDPRREIDVVSCHIFGYGQTVLPTASAVLGDEAL